MKICSVCQRCYEDDIFSCIKENHHAFADERPGSREIIKGFRLDSLLRSEATGKTYRATNLSLDEPCLIKIINPVITDGQKSNQQFLQEAQLMAALSHPNLVRVDKFGVLASNEFYLVTEDIGGQTLRDFLSKVSLPSEVTAVQIARQTAEGLEAIHAAGVAHRNINPENIILTSDAEHRLLIKIQNFDFVGFNQQLTTLGNSNTQHRLSQLRYFSPEQCEGQTVDAQTDIYSLGIVLYEMLAGHPPFDAADADELIDKQKNILPPEVKISNFDIRALLTYTLTDSLQKIPRLRLKKAGAFARQLRHIEQLVTHSSTPPPAASAAHSTKRVIPVAEQKDQKLEVPKVITNEVPPLTEPVIETLALESRLISETEPVWVEEVEVNDIQPISGPAMIEWEQPEDIPSEMEVLKVRSTEFGESEVVQALFSVDDESAESETFEPALLIEIDREIDRLPADASPMFSQYTDSQSPRFPLTNQKMLTGAGAAMLVILVVIVGSLLSRESHPARLPEQPAAKSPAPEKSLPKVEEEDFLSKENLASTEKSDESELKETAPTQEIPPILGSKVSDVKKRQTLASAAKRPEQDQMSKQKPDNKRDKNGLTSVERSSNNEAVKQKTPADNKPAEKKQTVATIKSDGLSRPRIVKLRVIP
jgi:serine/threonine protein kinase